jgi:hypothetical protein
MNSTSNSVFHVVMPPSILNTCKDNYWTSDSMVDHAIYEGLCWTGTGFGANL